MGNKLFKLGCGKGKCDFCKKERELICIPMALVDMYVCYECVAAIPQTSPPAKSCPSDKQ